MSSTVIQAFFTHGFGQLQCKPGHPAGASENFALDPGRLNLAGSVGRSMPEGVLRKMEQVFKADFSDVRIYQGPQAGSIGAHAFTMGSRIYFAPGQYSPDTARGQQLLGHELAHVLQQRSGRVRTPAGGGMVVVNDHALEAEADRMGVIAASFRPPVQAKMAAPVRPSVQAKPASHKLVIGAYMHQGAAGGGVPPDLAGHAFVSVQSPTGKQETWGFSPANYGRYNPQTDIGKLRTGVPGLVHRDDQAFSKPGVKTRSYTLTPAQAKAAMAKIDEYKTRQYKFSAQSRQCTTFASDVLRAAHVDGAVSGKLPSDLYRKV
ncbi:DUF4157 domain-containing protein [Massilia sp. CF038]|uniref:eCIS core domain-containing protein n=1 Tax=Massilia sp. CF038 TaxID=1881045 RepID=UPI0009139474|nr:DUF4157 domain-containing protein [Massilia sp. CF038]SHH09959.1 protein of unknown function [Massilia sp. CF038]